MAASLTDLAALDAHMLTASYVEGAAPSQADISVFNAISTPPADLVHALRWYSHIKSFSAAKASSLPGTYTALAAAAPAKSAAAPAKAAPKEPKEQKPKEEKPKKEAPPQQAKETPEEKAAKQAAKDKEKLLKAVVKEGGKKGVEIEGAADMGGLEFFCTTCETPDGDLALLQMCMDAMNAEPDPEAEDRKGCSGAVGKMIFSAGTKQLAMVGYVPEDKVAKVEIKEWMEAVCAAVDGKIEGAATKAVSPNGGFVISAVVLSDPEKGKFALKDKDAAMAAGFAHLRSKGAFPDDDGDDSDEMVFGDDDNLDDYA